MIDAEGAILFDFNGVIVGAPAMRTNFSGIGDEWVATMLNRAAPVDAAASSATPAAAVTTSARERMPVPANRRRSTWFSCDAVMRPRALSPKSQP